MGPEERLESGRTERDFIELVKRIQRDGLRDEIAEWEPEIARAENPNLRGEIAKLVGFYWLRRGDYARALTYSGHACELLPQDLECEYNAAFALFQMGRLREVIERGKRALRKEPEHVELCNLLSTCLGALGQEEEARLYGTRSLELKAASATGAPFDASGVTAPPFDGSRPERNVISFSLFGADPQYTHAAIHNVLAARYIYPRWTCRFYVDRSVPQVVVKRLVAEGGVVKLVNGLPSETYGTMWRFLVADDPNVDRFLVRDADSVVNVREKAAVEEWIDSGRLFHVMRDHYNHSELVLAGLWGGVKGALPSIMETFQRFVATRNHVLGRTLDQEFLRFALWTTIRQSVLTHDSWFDFGDRTNFPAYARLPAGSWVGCKALRLTRQSEAGPD